MRACKSCHQSKVKCNRHECIPCSRCLRLNLKCVEHVSRQGKGQRKKKCNSAPTPSAVAKKTEIEGDIADSTSKLGPNHYGIHFLIRSWVSYSMTRRSFGLLAKASALAVKCGISLDNILSGQNKFKDEEVGENRKMEFLSYIVAEPVQNQCVHGDPLLLSELPQSMLGVLDLMPADQASSRNPDSRWIWIREMKYGTSRFYTSAAFSRDIASWESIQQTWIQNKKQVKDLWMSPEEYRGYTQGFIHQISLQNVPDVPPTPTLMPTTKIRVRGRKGPIQVECAMCLHIVNLDHAFCFFEYFLPAPEPSEPIPAVQSSSQETMDDSLNDRVLDDFLDTIEEFQWNSDSEQLLETFEASLKPVFV